MCVLKNGGVGAITVNANKRLAKTKISMIVISWGLMIIITNYINNEELISQNSAD